MYILRKLITLTIIFSLAFFEVGQSIQMNSAFSQTDIGVSTTVGSEGKAVEMESEGMFAANRWVNTVALMMVGTISLLAAKMCFDRTKQQMGINCGLSTISLGVAGTALLAGYIWSWVKFQDRSFSKIHVSGLKNDGTLTEDSKLAQYANLCKKIQEDGYDLGGKTPDQIQQDAEANGWPIPGGATGESITLYCDQYGSLKVQKNVLQNMLDGLFAEVIFLAAAEAALLTALGSEIYEATQFWKREKFADGIIHNFMADVMAYDSIVKTFIESNLTTSPDGVSALTPCGNALNTCHTNAEIFLTDRTYYDSTLFLPITPKGEDAVPLCGQKEKQNLESYKDMINFCIHAVWLCEYGLAQLSTIQIETKAASTQCTAQTPAPTQAKTRKVRCRNMLPDKLAAINTKYRADNIKRAEIRRLHALRRTTELQKGSREWELRVAIGNIDSEGAGRKMGGNMTDRNSKIYLLPLLKPCPAKPASKPCAVVAAETAALSETSRAKSILFPKQRELQKQLPLITQQGTNGIGCTLDQVRKERLKYQDQVVVAAMEKIRLSGNTSPTGETARADVVTKPVKAAKEVGERTEEAGTERDKAVGTGCMISCTPPGLLDIPVDTDTAVMEYHQNDDQIWNNLLESVIRSAIAKKNEESTIGTQTAVSGVIGIVGIGGAAFGILLKKAGTFQKLFHKTPGTRMGWIGGMIALVGVAIATNRVAASQVKDDISKLNIVISEATGGEGGGSLPTGDDPPDEEDPKDPDPAPEEGPDIAETSAEDSSSTNTGRPGGGGFSGVFGGGSNFNIKDLAIAPRNKNIFVGATSASKNSGASAASASKPVPGMQEVQDFGNEVQRGELRGQQNIKALAARAKKLSSKKNLIQKFVDKAKNKLNAVLKRSGQKPIDFKKRGQIALASIMTPIKNSKNPKIQAALKGNNLLASLPKNLSSGNESSFKLPQMNDYSSSSDYSSGQSFGGDSFDDDLPKTADEIQANEEIKELDIKMDSINKRSDVSIFKVITRRYLRSAYPVFFKSK